MKSDLCQLVSRLRGNDELSLSGRRSDVSIQERTNARRVLYSNRILPRGFIDRKIEGRDLVPEVCCLGLKPEDFFEVDERVLGTWTFGSNPAEAGANKPGRNSTESNLLHDSGDESPFFLSSGPQQRVKLLFKLCELLGGKVGPRKFVGGDRLGSHHKTQED